MDAAGERGRRRSTRQPLHHLKVRLHTVKGEYPRSRENALTCSRLFGIDLPAHPGWEELQTEYEKVWRNLDEGRLIEGLIDLPLMNDPEMQVAMHQVELAEVSYYRTSICIACSWCRNGEYQHAVRDGVGLGRMPLLVSGLFSDPPHRYHEGYRLGKLACDLVEKHGFTAYQTKGLSRYGRCQRLDAADYERDSNSAGRPFVPRLDRRSDLRWRWHANQIHHMSSPAETIHSMSCGASPEIALTSPGCQVPATSSTPSGASNALSQRCKVALRPSPRRAMRRFDEAAFEAQLTGDRMKTMICLYWILKLKARFLSGDYAEALAAAEQVKRVLWGVAGQFYLLDYSYYTALTVAALYENGSAEEQAGWRDLLTVHGEQLHVVKGPRIIHPRCSDKHALVSGEVARLEGRDSEAMRLYEKAIKSAREHGFWCQNEGLAHEVAARFYAARGVETIAYDYLRERPRLLSALGCVRQGAAARPALSRIGGGAGPVCAECDRQCACRTAGCRDGGQGFTGKVSSEMELGKAHRDAHEDLARARRGGSGPAHTFHGRRASHHRRGRA